MELRSLKLRFDIIGDNQELNRALEIAVQVAKTDLSVLVTGESGVGKESIPKIIHENSPRKHHKYIAVNCGAIPEGTIDSELFGHMKGSFTGAYEDRKGYFEEADGGTLFLDEVAELPLSTQARLLRVLQTGEFIRVGSSKVYKTNVRVIAATNINLTKAIENGKFREDLYYRLNTVPVFIPSLRDRKEDISLLFRKFALDFADKYQMPVIKLSPDAMALVENYRWPGNIRQLKSIVENISVVEIGSRSDSGRSRIIEAEVITKYLPRDPAQMLPVRTEGQSADHLTDRDIIYKILYQLRQEVEMLKGHVMEGNQPTAQVVSSATQSQIQESASVVDYDFDESSENSIDLDKPSQNSQMEKFSIHEVSFELIKKALEKHAGNRKLAAADLGISERTLYRKIKEMK